jgi:hypothetical protein
MPLVSVYIRVADIEAWKDMPNKSQAVHDMLHAHKRSSYNRDDILIKQQNKRISEYRAGQEPVSLPAEIKDKFVKAKDLPITPSVRPASPPTPSVPVAQTARHTAHNNSKPQPIEEQPCCKEPSPCRHWVWDIGSGDGYINSISGRKKVTE